MNFQRYNNLRHNHFNGILLVIIFNMFICNHQYNQLISAQSLLKHKDNATIDWDNKNKQIFNEIMRQWGDVLNLNAHPYISQYSSESIANIKQQNLFNAMFSIDHFLEEAKADPLFTEIHFVWKTFMTIDWSSWYGIEKNPSGDLDSGKCFWQNDLWLFQHLLKIAGLSSYDDYKDSCAQIFKNGIFIYGGKPILKNFNTDDSNIFYLVDKTTDYFNNRFNLIAVSNTMIPIKKQGTQLIKSFTQHEEIPGLYHNMKNKNQLFFSISQSLPYSIPLLFDRFTYTDQNINQNNLCVQNLMDDIQKKINNKAQELISTYTNWFETQYNKMFLTYQNDSKLLLPQPVFFVNTQSSLPHLPVTKAIEKSMNDNDDEVRVLETKQEALPEQKAISDSLPRIVIVLFVVVLLIVIIFSIKNKKISKKQKKPLQKRINLNKTEKTIKSKLQSQYNYNMQSQYNYNRIT